MIQNAGCVASESLQYNVESDKAQTETLIACGNLNLGSRHLISYWSGKNWMLAYKLVDLLFLLQIIPGLSQGWYDDQVRYGVDGPTTCTKSLVAEVQDL